MEPYYTAEGVTLHLGDCLDVLPALADASVDAIVTDPPYGIGFMGKQWDTPGSFVERCPAKAGAFDHVGGNHNPSNAADAVRTRRTEAARFGQWCGLWAPELLRVLKPGGHLVAFGSPRTYHRLTVALEDAGFEIRDSLHWIYGSGMPKGQNIGKAIDRQRNDRSEVLRVTAFLTQCENSMVPVTTPATNAGRQWQGWNTQLSPAHEPIVLARKSTGYNTTMANVLEHGTGAINVDACRTEAGQDYREKCASVVGIASPRNSDTLGEWTGAREDSAHAAGRWPTNVLLGHGPGCVDDGNCQGACPVAEMNRQSSGASRFFPVFRYEAKAPSSERPRLADGTAHTTVKPLNLMSWLVRLVTPPGGLVLDPFAGSGATLEAAVAEGFHVVGVELDPKHAELCVQRLSKPIESVLFGIGP